ncbi:6-phospho-3-hexuloisomerase [Levilactobacillus bambusae]|uniref:6-phospho-3-hexuloisomerase n=1 Tax=Levilactobacillus bambusae TaxID=2024736 RepID=A0A2V1MYU5_9LACO|nr:6-phospho-3-hexuloisomerase [Levilactobacillus bambusae]PWG00181.1 6-phospho-3-hexuloisomerase [Levilactobacillus bambusae]
MSDNNTTNPNQIIPTVLNEITTVMDDINADQLVGAMDFITKSRRIFVVGAGRSGFQAKGFAMRLMHIGYTDYVFGETITPSIHEGDTLVAISGSGNTSSVVETAEKAKKLGLAIVAFTSDPDSKLAKLADRLVIVPGATKTGAGVQSIQLLSTLFDQTVHITLDVLCLMLSRRDGTSNQDALGEHVNVE